MLENAYPYCLVQKEQGDNLGLRQVLLYHFKSAKSHLIYMVRVEVYDYDVYAVKFYLKKHSQSPNKYRLMAQTYEPRRIINTCINIMLQIFAENPNASFGFVGANGFDEPVANTKRYRVYSRIIATYFSEQYFYHKENIGKSAYMLINKEKLAKNPNLVKDIEQFFIRQYEYFE